jgi:hypothetical protein
VRVQRESLFRCCDSARDISLVEPEVYISNALSNRPLELVTFLGFLITVLLCLLNLRQQSQRFGIVRIKRQRVLAGRDRAVEVLTIQRYPRRLAVHSDLAGSAFQELTTFCRGGRRGYCIDSRRFTARSNDRGLDCRVQTSSNLANGRASHAQVGKPVLGSFGQRTQDDLLDLGRQSWGELHERWRVLVGKLLEKPRFEGATECLLVGKQLV